MPEEPKVVPSPCQVEALKRCLEEHNGDHSRYACCRKEVEAFSASCGASKALIQETVDTLRFAAAPLLHIRRQPREPNNGEAADRKPIGDAADSFLLELSKV